MDLRGGDVSGLRRGQCHARGKRRTEMTERLPRGAADGRDSAAGTVCVAEFGTADTVLPDERFEILPDIWLPA